MIGGERIERADLEDVAQDLICRKRLSGLFQVAVKSVSHDSLRSIPPFESELGSPGNRRNAENLPSPRLRGPEKKSRSPVWSSAFRLRAHTTSGIVAQIALVILIVWTPS